MNVAADPFEEGKAPFRLQGAAIVMEVEVVSEHDPEPVPFPEIVSPDFPVAEIFSHVRIVVIFGGFGDPVPAFQEERKTAFFKTGARDEAVPASRQRFGLAVGLVVETHVSLPSGHVSFSSMPTMELPV